MANAHSIMSPPPCLTVNQGLCRLDASYSLALCHTEFELFIPVYASLWSLV